MLKYVLKRILIIIPIVLAVIFVLFILIDALPGSNIRQAPIHNNGDALDSVFAFFNAGENLFTRYARYCYNVFFHFDFGQSAATRVSLTGEISRHTRVTLAILAGGAGAATFFGIPIGAYAAVHKNGKRDRIINIVTLIFSAIPNYALALVIALIFVMYLGLLPMMGRYTSPVSYIMPTLTLALGGISLLARMTRASMLEELRQPYIIALRSKGLKKENVVYRHALKNAAVTVISVLGGFFSQLICGTFVVEHFFNIPGIGLYMLRAVGLRDHLEILGCTVTMAVILAAINVATDVLYAFVNPQIRLRYAKGERDALKKTAAE